MNRTLYALLFIVLGVPGALAQCPAGEVEVTIDVITDAYGNETYWELAEGTTPCGSDPIFVGGNPSLDCTDGNTDLSIPGGYGNNITISEGPWCLVEGANYTIHSVDSYGDGHASFTVFVNGVPTATFSGQGPNLQHVFTALPPQAIDLSVTKLTTALFAEEGVPVTVRGVLTNLGTTSVQSFTLNYRINGGADVAEAIEGITLAAAGTYEFAHTTAWAPNSSGTFELEVWASNINGGADQAPANDARTSIVKVFPAIPDRIAEYLAAEPLLTVVADDDEDLLVPRDLDFHPDRDRNELWVINKDVAQSGGSTVRFFEPGAPEMTFLWQRDPNAWHFMSLPTAIAMGDNGNFATSPGIFDANQNGGDPFTGPTLWSSDPAIYAQNQFGPLGSHLDMLHVNPRSQGIAHDHWNRYWVVRCGDERLPRGPWSGPELPRRCPDPALRCLQHHPRPQRPRGIALRDGQEHRLVIRGGPWWPTCAADEHAQRLERWSGHLRSVGELCGVHPGGQLRMGGDRGCGAGRTVGHRSRGRSHDRERPYHRRHRVV
ncbi:MAG: hypothetical protein MUE88_07670 [Flavobacteriales bacterium]|nr:hypothetical protein [Flavobacteriales bacterium]